MIKLRLQKTSDAARFYEILNNPNFIYFNVQPKTVVDEANWIKASFKRRKQNTEWNYTILDEKKILGSIGVKINYHRNYIGEIGYFLDENYWGKGIISEAVKLMEDICFEKLKLSRIEIVMQPENKASEKVAIKNGYLKEGLLKNLIKGKDGEMKDYFLYAKVNI